MAGDLKNAVDASIVAFWRKSDSVGVSAVTPKIRPAAGLVG